MLMSKVMVHLPRGLQARNSVLLVELASSFNSDIAIVKEDVSCSIDILNIIKLMDLNVKEGQEITLIANGPDEMVAFDVLKDFFCKLNNTRVCPHLLMGNP